MAAGEDRKEKAAHGKRRGEGNKERRSPSPAEHDAKHGRNVSNAKVKVKQSDVEKLVEQRRQQRLKKEEQAKKELSKREEKHRREKAKAAEKQKKDAVKVVEKRKKARAKRTARRRKKAPVPEAEEAEEAEKEAVAPAAEVAVEAQASEAAEKGSRWRLPWKKKAARRVQTVAANSRMAIPGRFLRIPPDLRLSRKDMRLARAFLQFPPPRGFPFKAGWPWTTTAQGHNVLVADSDCEDALRLRRTRNAALAKEMRRLDRQGGGFLERHAARVQPRLAAMPTLLAGPIGGGPATELSRKERRRFLDMPLSMCPQEELRRWCDARRPHYFSLGGRLSQGSPWRAEEDFCSDSDASEEEVEFFLKQEARKCVDRVRRKAAMGKGCARMMHSLLQRFEAVPPPLEMPASSRTFRA